MFAQTFFLFNRWLLKYFDVRLNISKCRFRINKRAHTRSMHVVCTTWRESTKISTSEQCCSLLKYPAHIDNQRACKQAHFKELVSGINCATIHFIYIKIKFLHNHAISLCYFFAFVRNEGKIAFIDAKMKKKSNRVSQWCL